jgi:WD40 repeat protein
MNTNLLDALKEIVSKHGGAGTLSDARRVKALLADLAAGEPKPHKNALVACIEQGFVPALQNVSTGERSAAKAKLAERLNREEGLDPALCADTLDLLETALFGGVSAKVAPPGTAAPGTPAPPVTVASKKPAPKRQLTPISLASQNKEGWRELRTIEGQYLVGYSPDGRKIIAKSDGGTFKIWDAESGHELQVLDARFATYSPDGHKIASVSDDGIKILDAESGRILQNLTGHTDSVSFVAYSPDGRKIIAPVCPGASFLKWVTTNEDTRNAIRIWDPENGLVLQTITAGHFDEEVTSVVYSPDGHKIVSALNNDPDHNTIKIWDAESGCKLHTLKLEYNERAESVVYSFDGRRIVSALNNDPNYTIKIWDVDSGRLLQTFKDGAEHIAYSPDGRRIVFASKNIIKIWDPESGLKPQTLTGHTGGITCFAYSPDGHRIVSGSKDKTIKIWDADSGCELQTLTGHTKKITSVEYSPNGRRIASGSDDYTIKIWGRE